MCLGLGLKFKSHKPNTSLVTKLGLIPEEHKQHLKEELQRNLKGEVKSVDAVSEDVFIQQVVLAKKSPGMYV